MEPIAQYTIVTADDPETLGERVNALIADGWQPVGAPLRLTPEWTLGQAMVLPGSKRIRRTSED